MSAAKDAAAGIECAITIRAGKTGIDRDALYFAAENPLQLFGECVVAFLWRIHLLMQRHLSLAGDPGLTKATAGLGCSVKL